MEYDKEITVRITEKMFKDVARLGLAVNDEGEYRKHGAGMTGVVRMAIQAEIDRIQTSEKALRA